MKIEIKNKCSDFDGPVLDIYFTDRDEAFEIGALFEKIRSNKKCVWVSKKGGFVRIPLIDMSETGTAITVKKKS